VPECDDGFFAEGYTEAVVKMLARWQSIPELTALRAKAPKFFAFVLKHINASADESDLKQILANVQQRCTAEDRELCGVLQKAAEKAIQELGA
jgi:hypothetical protein